MPPKAAIMRRFRCGGPAIRAQLDCIRLLPQSGEGQQTPEKGETLESTMYGYFLSKTPL